MAVTDQTELPTTEEKATGAFAPSEAFLKKRRARSIAIALLLAGTVVLFYVVTLVKLGPGVLDRPM